MVLAFEAGIATAGLKQPQGSATTVATGSLAADNGIYCIVVYRVFSNAFQKPRPAACPLGSFQYLNSRMDILFLEKKNQQKFCPDSNLRVKLMYESVK